MDRAHAILTPEQQNMQKRVQDCDGCHDPANPPVFSMLVIVGHASGGEQSRNLFMICRRCAAKPVQLFLHGKGYCAPGIVVEVVEPPDRSRKAKPPPPALDVCISCGHQRGFHVNNRCEYDKFARGCTCHGFVER